MKLDWYKELGGRPEEIDERKTLVRNSSLILKVINNILDRWEKEYSSMPRPDYADAAWALRAADANGYMRALKELKQLIAPDQEVE